MAPSQSPLHGLNLIPPEPQHLTDAHSHDLLSGPHFPDLAAQLDLWTNLTFESDEPLVRDSLKDARNFQQANSLGSSSNNPALDGIGALSSCSADEYGSTGGFNPSLDGIGALSSCSSLDEDNDNIASSEGHVNVVNPSALPQQPLFPPGIDLSSILNVFGINPYMNAQLPGAAQQPQPNYASLAHLLSAIPQLHQQQPPAVPDQPPAKRRARRPSSILNNGPTPPTPGANASGSYFATPALPDHYQSNNPPPPSTYAASDSSQDSTTDPATYQSDSTLQVSSHQQQQQSALDDREQPFSSSHSPQDLTSTSDVHDTQLSSSFPNLSTPLTAAEDKRRRNTAASARFRLKKKEREAALERRSKDLEVRVSELERECEGLRRENGWLKGLVVGVTGVTGVGGPPSAGSMLSPPGDQTPVGSKRRRRDVSPNVAAQDSPESNGSSAGKSDPDSVVREAADAAAIAVMGRLKESVRT